MPRFWRTALVLFSDIPTLSSEVALMASSNVGLSGIYSYEGYGSEWQWRTYKAESDRKQAH